MTQEKRLFKARNNRIFFGVCGGIGEYLGIDPNAVRSLHRYRYPCLYHRSRFAARKGVSFQRQKVRNKK